MHQEIPIYTYHNFISRPAFQVPTSSEVKYVPINADTIGMERPAKMAHCNQFALGTYHERNVATEDKKSALDFDDSFTETMLLALKDNRKILRSPRSNVDKENGWFSPNAIATVAPQCPMAVEKVRVRDHRWKEHFEELVAFKNLFGHTNVTQTKSKILAEWVKNQRRLSKQGKLSVSRTERLSSLGFEWDRSYLFKSKSSETDQPAAATSPRKRKAR